MIGRAIQETGEALKKWGNNRVYILFEMTGAMLLFGINKHKVFENLLDALVTL